MTKIKGSLLILLLMTTFFMISCTQKQNIWMEEISLSKLKGSYELYDFTDFGLWYLSIPESILKNEKTNAQSFILKIEEKSYHLESNKVEYDYLRTTLPDYLTPQQISNGKIICLFESINLRNSDFVLNIDQLIIEKDEIQNGTNLYEVNLLDYLDLKQANQFVFNAENLLIRPSYVKSTEENAYSIKNFYDAKHASLSKTVEGAFNFLKNLDYYENYLFFDNPNRVFIESQIVKINEPDTRDRLRQLGEFGALSIVEKTYNIRDNTVSGLTTQIKKSNLSSKYDEIHYLNTQVRGNKTYEFEYTSDFGIIEAVIPYTDTNNIELIKNSRISVAKKILLYSKSGVLKDSFNSIKEAAQVSDNKDTIRVTGGTYYNHAGQIEIAATELTIKSTSAEPFIIDLTGSVERAFCITKSASVTMQNAQIKNINASTNGGAVYIENATLTTHESTFSNNTADFGAAVYINNGGLNCFNSYFTDNNSDKVGGAVYINSGTFNSTNTTIKNNRASGNYGAYFVGGAAVFVNFNAEFNADHTLISENYSMKDGGGIYVKGLLNLSNSTVTHNRTDWSGGAIFIEGGTLNLINTILSNNLANENRNTATTGWGGGALMICKNGTVNATDTIITSNSANTLDGGGISIGGEGSGILNGDNLIISSNTAGRNGGGIFLNGIFNAEKATINSNTTGNSGGGIYLMSGTIKTNSQLWSSLNSQQNNFSVDLNAFVQPYNNILDVNVFNNIATNDPPTNQMKGF